MSKILQVTQRNGICTVRINRPEVRNVMSVELMNELTGVARKLQDAPGVRAVILAANGANFTAGADLKDPRRWDLEKAGLAEQRAFPYVGERMCQAWEDIPAMTVCAVEGHCIGGGAALAVSLDFRFCGRSAHFRIPEVELGMNMSWGSIPRMVALMGPARTKQAVILASDRIDAHEAYDWGLVEKVVDDGQVLDTAMAFAARIAEQPPLPVRMSKTTINRVAFALAEGVSHMDPDQNVLTALTEDFAEGTAAFRERRKPKFSGR